MTRTSGRLGARPGRILGHAGADGHEHRPQLGGGPLRARAVALVDDDDVRHLEQPGLDRLDLVAHLGCLEDDRRVGGRGDLHLALARAHRLEEDDVEPGGVEHGRGGGGRGREPARMAARAIERMKTPSSDA